MRYPDFVKKHDTLGFIAPSFGSVIEPYHTCFESALDRFRRMGYGIDLGPNCFRSDGIGISSSPSNCGQELTDYYCSDANQALLTCGGGEMMCEILPYVDFERIRNAKPKWYMGFSDNTNFTFLSATICDTAAIYGPHAPTFGMKRWHPSVRDAYELLIGAKSEFRNYPKWEREKTKSKENPLASLHCTEPFHMVTVLPENTEGQEICFSGRLIGGCMDCLVNLLGTEFDHTVEFCSRYQEDGIIWFLESCDLNTMGIRRALWQMKHAGWFEHVKGFLIGRPGCYGEELFGTDPYASVIDMLKEYQVPILMDLDIGHIAPIMPIVSGASAEISAGENSLSILYTWK